MPPQQWPQQSGVPSPTSPRRGPSTLGKSLIGVAALLVVVLVAGAAVLLLRRGGAGDDELDLLPDLAAAPSALWSRTATEIAGDRLKCSVTRACSVSVRVHPAGATILAMVVGPKEVHDNVTRVVLAGLDVRTGAQIWTRATAATEARCTPDADPQRMLCTFREDNGSALEAVDVATGTAAYRVDLPRLEVVRPQLLRGERYVVGGDPADRSVLVVKVSAGGAKEWERTFSVVRFSQFLDKAGAYVRIGFPDKGSLPTVFDPRTGDVVPAPPDWDHVTPYTGDTLAGLPSLRMEYTAKDSMLYALSPSDPSRVLWQRADAYPSGFCAGRLLLSSIYADDDKVEAVDPLTGASRWSAADAELVACTTSHVLLQNQQGYAAVNSVDGTSIWQAKPPPGEYSGATVVGGQPHLLHVSGDPKTDTVTVLG